MHVCADAEAYRGVKDLVKLAKLTKEPVLVTTKEKGKPRVETTVNYGDAPGSALWFSSKLWHETGATPPGTQKLVLFFGKSDGAGKSDSAGKSDGAGPSDNTDNVAESRPKKKRKMPL